MSISLDNNVHSFNQVLVENLFGEEELGRCSFFIACCCNSSNHNQDANLEPVFHDDDEWPREKLKS